MDKSKPVRTTLYLPADLWKSFRLEAVKRDETATQLVVWAMEQWIRKGGKR
jgi:hypothetical protein